jgi:DNA polymerase gamma 1
MKAYCSDVKTTGAITGRTSGLITTLSNPKDYKLGSDIKALLQNTQGTDYRIVSFDVSGEEITIVAAYQAYQYCKVNGLKPHSLCCPGAEAAFLGRADNGTDFHTVAAKDVGIERRHSKTLSFSMIYGAGLVSSANLLRPLMLNVSETDLQAKVKKYQVFLKGTKVRGQFRDGLFSEFFNYAQELINKDYPELPFQKQKITNTLRPKYCGTDYYTSRVNWTVQGTGSAILDKLGYEIDLKILDSELDAWFSSSVHDQLTYICHKDQTKDLANYIRLAYAKTWKAFFRSLGLEAPDEVCRNIQITEDFIDRKEPNSAHNTLSTPDSIRNIANGLYI